MLALWNRWLAWSLVGLGLSGAEAVAHPYEICYEQLAQDCAVNPSDQDPLNDCYHQADAFCSNHGHGGGGFEPLDDPKFTIEDQEDTLIVNYTFDVKNLTEHQRELVKQALTATEEYRRAKRQLRLARFRLLLEASSTDDK